MRKEGPINKETLEIKTPLPSNYHEVNGGKYREGRKGGKRIRKRKKGKYPALKTVPSDQVQ